MSTSRTNAPELKSNLILQFNVNYTRHIVSSTSVNSGSHFTHTQKMDTMKPDYCTNTIGWSFTKVVNMRIDAAGQLDTFLQQCLAGRKKNNNNKTHKYLHVLFGFEHIALFFSLSSWLIQEAMNSDGEG